MKKYIIGATLLISMSTFASVHEDSTKLLMDASKSGNIKLAKQLLEEGISVNSTQGPAWNQRTPISEAVTRYFHGKNEPKDNVEMIEFLVSEGADVHRFVSASTLGAGSGNALILSFPIILKSGMQVGHINNFHYLLKNTSIDINKKISNGTTVLSRYVEYSHDPKYLDELISSGAKMDSARWPILFYTVFGNNKVMLEELVLRRGIDINSTSTSSHLSGQTSLHKAMADYKFGIVRQLLSLGADPNIQDSEGNTPLHMVVQNKLLGNQDRKPFSFKHIEELQTPFIECLELPENACLKFDGKMSTININNNIRRALIVVTLIEKGANLFVRNNEGISPFDLMNTDLKMLVNQYVSKDKILGVN